MAPTRKRKQKFAGRCIFCEGTRLTKEHVWPNWLGNYLSRDAPYTLHTTSFGKIADGNVTHGIRIDKRRTGDPKSRKLRIVCRDCNNGWMSRLQTECKSFLPSYIAGEWPGLDNAQQQQLAAWATMFTMVCEFADPRTRATPRVQHEEFKQTKVPPEGWKIWIAPVVEGWKDGPNHLAWKEADTNDAPEVLADQTLTAQVTAWCLGGLFMMTFSRIRKFDDDDEENESVFAAKHGLEVLWPLQERTISKPARTLDYTSANVVTKAILPSALDRQFYLDVGELPASRRP
jgi:hypothetical protein